MSWQQRISAALYEAKAACSLRMRTVMEKTGRFLICDKRRFLNFSSNDYLGLSKHPAVIRAWQQGAEIYGVGSCGSGHVSGYTTAHQQLEAELANWLGYSRALLFISGFSANQAAITALAGKNDLIVADRLSHASLLEAGLNSPAKLRRFYHNDVYNLAELLSAPCAGQQLVVTEGVFSMDGDSAPLAEIKSAAIIKNAWILVDDAHGIGVTGEAGRGSCASKQVKPELLVITFGKCFGVSGAAILCSDDLADYILQFSRHIIYSTCMPPAQAVAILAALNIIKGDEGEELRQKLEQHILQLREGLTSLPVKMTISPSKSHIQPLILGTNSKAQYLANILRNKGIWVTAIRPPTVPPGTARLRITLTAEHESDDIALLLEAICD